MMQCPLCGSDLILKTDETYLFCPECNFDEQTMAIEEESHIA